MLRTFGDASTIPFSPEDHVDAKILCRLRVESPSSQEQSGIPWVFVEFCKQCEDKTETVQKWIYESSLLSAFPNCQLPDELSALQKRTAMEMEKVKETSSLELQRLSQSFDAYKKRSKTATALLQERNEEVTSQVAKLQSELTSSQQQLLQMKEQIQHQSADSDHLLHMLQAQLEETKSEVASLKSEKVELEKLLEEKETILASQTSKISELNSVVEAEQTLSEIKEHNIQEQQAMIQELQQQVSTLIQKTAQSSVKSVDDSVNLNTTAAPSTSEGVTVETEEPLETLAVPVAFRESYKASSDESRLSRWFKGK